MEYLVFYQYTEYFFLVIAVLAILVLLFGKKHSTSQTHPFWGAVIALLGAFISCGLRLVTYQYVINERNVWLSAGFLVLGGISIISMIYNWGQNAGAKNLLGSILCYVSALLMFALI